MNNLIFICFLLLSALNAWADDAPKQEAACRREADGRVSCSPDGFKALTDGLVEMRGGLEKAALRQQACVASRDAAEVALTASEARAKTAEDKLAAIKPPDTLRPVLAVAGAVVGAVALSAAVLTPLPDQARIGLGAGGLGLLVAGFVFVLPERMP